MCVWTSAPGPHRRGVLHCCCTGKGHKDNEDLVATCDLWPPPKPWLYCTEEGRPSLLLFLLLLLLVSSIRHSVCSLLDGLLPSLLLLLLFFRLAILLFDSTSFLLHFTRRFSGTAAKGISLPPDVQKKNHTHTQTDFGKGAGPFCRKQYVQ